MIAIVRVALLLLVVAPPAAAAEFTGVAGKIQDGDTFDLCNEGSCVRIRLCGIDTPEEGMAGAEAAKVALTRLVDRKQIRCVQVGDGTPCGGRSKPTNQGRIVAQCFVPTDIAAELVRAGHACDWVKFSVGHYGGRECPR